MHPHLVVAEPHRLRVVEHVDGRRRLDLQSKHLGLLDGTLVERQVVPVEGDGDGEHVFRRAYAADVVDVGVRQQDVPDAQAVRAHGGHELRGLVARIDDNGLPRALAAGDVAVLEEGWSRAGLEDHNVRMVLCAVDDLIFSVKISTAAKSLGTPVFFERNPEMVLPRIRETRPSLVIFDLNSATLRPLDVIAAMKADGALGAVRTLGYASHVQADVIAEINRRPVRNRSDYDRAVEKTEKGKSLLFLVRRGEGSLFLALKP